MDRATKKRLISLTVALIVVLPLSVVAARWQWNRHVERDARNAAVMRAEQTDPVPWSRLAATHADIESLEWRRVTATGTWAANRQLLVRKQSVNGRVGYTVMTPLDVDALGMHARLLVLRGWVPDTVDPADPLAIPLPSAGPVTVELRLRVPTGDGEVRPADLPAGQINFVDPLSMRRQFNAAWWDGRTPADGVFELVDPVPAGMTPLPWPELTSGPHVSYFVQWILIGLTAIVVYIRVFRSETRREDEQT